MFHHIMSDTLHRNFAVRVTYFCASIIVTYLLILLVMHMMSRRKPNSSKKYDSYMMVDPYTIVDLTHRRLAPSMYEPITDTSKLEYEMAPGQAVIILVTEPPGGVIISDMRGNLVDGRPHPEHLEEPRDITTDTFEVFVNGQGVRGFKRYQFRRAADVRNTWIITL